MNATTEPPRFAGLVASSWASAITSPSADSPAAFPARVIAAVVEPTTRLAIGADRALYLSTIFCCAGSAGTSRVTITLLACSLVMSLVRLLNVRSSS